MKVAISIPDPLFAEGEKLAKRWKMSRSRFYARAIETVVARYSDDEITRLANEAYEELSEEDHAMLRAGARTALENTEW